MYIYIIKGDYSMSEYTYDEYFAILQTTPEGKETINSAIIENDRIRYENRHRINRDITLDERLKLFKISPKQYKELRAIHIMQLYEAYMREERGEHRPLMSVSSSFDTNPEHVRRVTRRATRVYI